MHGKNYSKINVLEAATSQGTEQSIETTNYNKEKKSLSEFQHKYSIEQTRAMKCFTWKPQLIEPLQAAEKMKNSDRGTPIIFSKDTINVNNGKLVKEYTVIPFNSKHLNILKKVNFYAYEILYADLPRKFHVDIDLKPTSPLFQQVNLAHMIQETISFVKSTIKKEFDHDPKDPDIFIVPDESLKKSAHLIFPCLLLKNTDEMKWLKKILQSYLHEYATDVVKECMDFAPYGNNQAFRIPYQSKLGKDNVLVPLDKNVKNVPIDKMLVGVYSETEFKSFCDHDILRIKAESTIKTHTLKLISETMKRPLKQHEEKYISKCIQHNFDVFSNLVHYDNTQLDVKHIDTSIEDQNRFYMSLIPNSSENPQPYQVWFAIGQTLKNISFVTGKDYLPLWIEWSNKASGVYKDEALECTYKWNNLRVRSPLQPKFQTNLLKIVAEFYYPKLCKDYHKKKDLRELFDISNADDTFDEVETYNDTSVGEIEIMNKTTNGYCKALDFDNFDVITSQAPMGSGKTFQVLESIKKHQFKRILIISPRQTFTKEKLRQFKEICPDFVDYRSNRACNTDDWGCIDKFIVQVESLKHLYNSEFCGYDLVILDEIESILLQFSSTTNSNVHDAWAAFVTIIDGARKIVMADAFVTRRTLFINSLIKQLRGRRVCRTKFDNNKHNPNKHKTANIIGICKDPNKSNNLKDKFTAHVINNLKQGRKLCIVTGSKKYLDQLVLDITTQTDLNASNILAYSAESDADIIDGLQNVEQTWGRSDIRVVIYTTKITVGIDFSLKDVFDHIYIYGSVFCPIARDLMQSHFRVRHTTDNNLYIALYACDIIQKTPAFNTVFKRCRTYTEQVDILFPYDECFNFREHVQSSSYIKLSAFNYQEQQIGYSDYAFIFTYLLKRIGYNIQYIDYGIKEDEGQRIMTGSIPAKYETKYHEYKLIPESKKLEIERKLQNERASSSEKSMLQCWFFYNTVLRKSFVFEDKKILDSYNNHDENGDASRDLLMKANFFDWSISETFEADMYYKYYHDTQFKHAIDNTLLEIRGTSPATHIERNKFNVLQDKENASQFKIVRDVCNILGIKTTLEGQEGHVWGDEHLMAYKEYEASHPKGFHKTIV